MDTGANNEYIKHTDTCAYTEAQIFYKYVQLLANGAITLARMSFRLFSVYESGVIF